jgi:hypothetical protein
VCMENRTAPFEHNTHTPYNMHTTEYNCVFKLVTHLPCPYRYSNRVDQHVWLGFVEITDRMLLANERQSVLLEA